MLSVHDDRKAIASSTSLMALTVVPAFLLGTLAPLILNDINAESQLIGQAYAMFFVMAGISAPAFGWLVDRGKVTPTGAPLLGAAAVTGVALAFSQHPWHIWAAVVLGGVAYGGGNPVTNVYLSNLTPKIRGIGLGIKQAGVPLASMASGALVPAMALALGWRNTFLFVAALAVAAFFWLRRGGGGSTVSRQRRSSAANAPVISLLRFRTSLATYAFLLSFATSCWNTYLVFFLVDDGHFNAAMAGTAVAIAGAVGVASRILLAHLSQKLSSSWAFGMLALLAVGAAVGCAMLAMGDYLRFTWIPALVLYGACLFGWGGILAVVLVRFAPASTGRSTGVVYFGFYAGLALGPIAFGTVVQPHWGFAAAWVMCALSCVLAIAATIPTLKELSSHKRLLRTSPDPYDQ